ncbi:5-dehydro-2-deoxygluconokinase [Micromonospora rubida]|uniref:5-dehydro-2-deoxygluconokinase n=1 Tax=Micromonospora rubida TaxID=2697657 RepID=UPI002E2AC0EE|nr:5-dehydro-2-deoxygluconokinase [Micromonospora rubida]
MTGFDLITVGRCGVDLYPLRSGVPLSEVDTFGRFLGGSPTNVAVAAARLGRHVAVVTRTGDDPFGDFVRTALKEYGVDDRFVRPVPILKTPITFCEIFPPDNFPLYFYREPKAPDLEIAAQELDLDALGAARIVWLTGTGLCAEPSRAALHAVLAHRRGPTVLDLDYRPMFWPSATEATGRYRAALASGAVSVAVGNREECAVATGEDDPERAAQALLDFGVALAVVKLGPEGVLGRTADGQRVRVPPTPVEVVNGLGAGDAFGGALCHGMLAGWPLRHTLRYASTAGAIVASRLACSAAMPTADEVSALLGENPDV